MDGSWQKIKNRILGKEYDLSIVPADDPLMKKLNEIYRGKKGQTTILSFPLSDKAGEIFINIPLAKRDAERAEIPVRQYLDYLFIHSLLT